MNKSILPISCFLSLVFSSVKLFSSEGDTLRIFISPGGNDNNPGNQDAPLKSIEKARGLIRLKGTEFPAVPVVVFIGCGNYHIDKPLIFTSEDSRTNNSRVLYTARLKELIL